MFKDFFQCDIVGCKLTYRQDSLHIFLVYIPRDVSVDDLVAFIECFECYSMELSNIFLIGDFNVPSFLNNTSDTKASTVRNMASLLNLRQFNTIRNFDGHILDLVFSTSNVCSIIRDMDPLIREDYYIILC